jgi:DeoR/GlpR family transcriptional regulator of sugar metabolism
MLSNAARAALVCDSSKIGLTSFITYARLEELDRVVTDDGRREEIEGLARSAGVELLLAPAQGD